MKKLIVLSALVLSGLTYQSASAQISFHVGVNLTPRPVYVEPAPVYNDAAYYYLPDVGAYYSVNEGCYYYQDGDSWVSAAYLPGAYRNYDWVHARRFAINQPRPYMHNDVYRARYNGFEGRRDWGRDDRFQQRTYAERGHFDNNPYRGEADHRGFDQRGNNYGQFGGRGNDHQQYDNRGGNRGNYGGGQGQPQGERGGNQGNYGGGQNQPQGNRGGNQNQGGGQGQPQGSHGNNGQGGQNDRGRDNGGQSMRGRF